MTKVEMPAKKREELGKKARKVRAAGMVPAVVYGRKFKPVPIAIGLQDFSKNVLQSEAGLNLIFSLKLEEEGKHRSVPVITYAVQKDPLTDKIIHIDFMHIVMDEQIKTKVPVELVGLPIGVKDDGGVLVHGMREIEIKCLPGDIPDKFTIDVSSLKINDSLHVSNLIISKKVEMLSTAAEMIATVSPPTKEEEVAPAAVTLTEAEAAAAAAAAPAVAEEAVKEKAAPGAAPAKEKAAPAKAAPATPEKK